MTEGQTRVISGHTFTVYRGYGIEVIPMTSTLFQDYGQQVYTTRIHPPFGSGFGVMGRSGTVDQALARGRAYVDTVADQRV